MEQTKKLSWILVRPELLLFCKDDLESFLREKGFSISCKKKISRLSDLSVKLYTNATPALSALYKSLFSQLFGKYAETAEIWYLESKSNSTLLEQFSSLNEIKKQFRKLNWKYDIAIMVEYNEEETQYGYSYFHVPDPCEEEVARESNLVEQYIT